MFLKVRIQSSLWRQGKVVILHIELCICSGGEGCIAKEDIENMIKIIKLRWILINLWSSFHIYKVSRVKT